MKYRFYYPDTGDVASPKVVETIDAGFEYYNQIGWESIPPQHPEDLLAFMNTITGDIIVLREVKES